MLCQGTSGWLGPFQDSLQSTGPASGSRSSSAGMNRIKFVGFANQQSCNCLSHLSAFAHPGAAGSIAGSRRACCGVFYQALVLTPVCAPAPIGPQQPTHAPHLTGTLYACLLGQGVFPMNAPATPVLRSTLPHQQRAIAAAGARQGSGWLHHRHVQRLCRR